MVFALNNQSPYPCHSLECLGITPDSKVIVVGLGVTGMSVLRYLLKQQLHPMLVDSRANPPGLQELRDNCLELEITTGEHAFDLLDTATHLIISPGVALTTPEIEASRQSGIQILSDIDLFAIEAAAPIIAITGSNGKTTVTTLVGNMIAHAGKSVAVGGNIGTPALDLLNAPEPDAYVLELSSFQLENTCHLQPEAAVVLNLSADHLDRYDDFSDYSQAKASIYNDATVIIKNFCEQSLDLNDNCRHHDKKKRYFGITDDQECHFRLEMIDDKEWLVAYDQPLLAVSDILIQGRHNISNALAALALVDAINIHPASAVAVLREFPGLPHRMEMVRDLHEVTWINDSKATNVGACLAALQGINSRIILIAGGDAKAADFSVLSNSINEKVSDMIVLGKDADLLQNTFQTITNMHHVHTIEDAVTLATSLSSSGDTVLLSPACASLDMFKDYQARGDAFKNAVMRLPQ